MEQQKDKRNWMLFMTVTVVGLRKIEKMIMITTNRYRRPAFKKIQYTVGRANWIGCRTKHNCHNCYVSILCSISGWRLNLRTRVRAPTWSQRCLASSETFRVWACCSTILSFSLLCCSVSWSISVSSLLLPLFSCTNSEDLRINSALVSFSSATTLQ